MPAAPEFGPSAASTGSLNLRDIPLPWQVAWFMKLGAAQAFLHSNTFPRMLRAAALDCSSAALGAQTFRGAAAHLSYQAPFMRRKCGKRQPASLEPHT